MSSALLNKLKRSGYDLLSETEIVKEKPGIRYNIPVLNLAFSGTFTHGLEVGTTIFAGPSSSFKTGLMLFTIKEFQEQFKKGVTIILNSEGGINNRMVENFGIDTTRTLNMNITHIGEMHNFLQELVMDKVSEDDDVLIIVDSIGNVATKGEIDRARDNKISADQGNRARELKSLFRTITPYILSKGIYTVFANHVYTPPEMYARQTMSGGSGPMYNANTVIFLNKVKNPNAKHPGDNRFNIYVEKSRRVSDGSRFFIDVYQGKGIDPLSNLEDLAKDAGIFKHHHGQYWDISFLNEETGEVEVERVGKKERDSLEFWARVMKDKVFLQYIEDEYLIKIDDTIMETSENIYDVIESLESGSDDGKEDKDSTKTTSKENTKKKK